MKVKEAIEILKKLDENLELYVYSSTSSDNVVTRINKIKNVKHFMRPVVIINYGHSEFEEQRY